MVFIFYSEGGIRKAALRNMPVACFNRRGFSAEKESHRPDLSARFIRRDGRLLAECQWHSATAVGARRPTTSKIFNGCLPQQMESHLLRRQGRRDSNSPEKFSSINKIFSPRGKFSIM